ncbi:hypothetical protein [Curtobacterium ammoniigenes]|uniref:hypothetical protein n=1 Tax=Curtobacterium ammoniigenes TaxID=395387 RepID=UPI00082EE9BB|nr:hypothetical protein [Curtobacterium ammoniigenes]
MELLFVVLGGIICGAIAHVVVPWRSLRGVILAPSLGGIVAAIVWESLTWAGWKYDGGWIWVAALVASGVVPMIVVWALGPARQRRDEQFFDEVRSGNV